jgi:hypothetical protein
MLRVLLIRVYSDAGRERSGKISELQFASTGGPGVTPPQLALISRDMSGTASAVPQSHIHGEQDSDIELAPGVRHSKRSEY